MFQNPGIRRVIAIALGAIPGALIRYLISEFSQVAFGKDFSYYGTFFVNITGCLLIAFFLTLNEERFKNWSPEIRLMVATGFCGAYTTFSTYGLETVTMLQKGNFILAAFYWTSSAIIGIIAILIGVSLARLSKKPGGEY
jgi:fluoride exporter